MKKVSILLLILILTFSLTGCATKRNKDEKTPARLKEITEKIVKTNTNNDGNIIIKENDITDKVIYISY